MWRVLGIATMLTFLMSLAAAASAASLYTTEQAFSRGVVNARISLFNATDQQDALESVGQLSPGVIYTTFVGVWGLVRQSDLDLAAQLASRLRQRLPKTIFGAGLNESILANSAPQTLACGAGMGQHVFGPADMTATAHQISGTAWLDLAKPAARDYYICVGSMLIDRGYTLIDFEEHSNVINRASSRPAAINNYLEIMDRLRQYGRSEGKTILFSGDVTQDQTATRLDCFYVPPRFYHLTFAQNYRDRVERPGVGVGYSYSLSPARVRDVLAVAQPQVKVFFYIDNWDPKQDDLRRFMELDGSNRRYLMESSARTAKALGAYFIPSLLHCANCVPADDVGDKCLIRPDGKTEYDALRCGDLPTIRRVLQIQQ